MVIELTTSPSTSGIYRVTRTFRFDSAHCLPQHDGKCKLQHGHSYEVTVLIEGGDLQPQILGENIPNPKFGMLIDYKDLKTLWKEVCGHLDHVDLNPLFNPIPTTAENIACMIFKLMEPGIYKLTGGNAQLRKVTVSEQQDTTAEFEVIRVNV